ncbi:MAG: glycosyltransferase family 4 protein [Acidimicrobiales bacterium]
MTTVGYLTGGYPRVTDSFIRREIHGVEDCGIRVERFAVRRPDDRSMVSDAQRRERELTTYLLGRGPAEYARALTRAARRSPRRFAAAAALAARTRRLGASGSFRQLAYFVEAAVLADLMTERGVDHLHDHFADASCTVAMLASALSGIPYSFTIHGPAIFFEPHLWHLDAKLRTATFCAAISSFARSQASLFCEPETWDRLHVVHCGVDPTDTSPAVERTDGRPVELLFVGRLEPVKGLLVLLDAVHRLVRDGDDVHLTIVGDGAERGDIEARTAELGLAAAVRFAGYRSDAEVRDHLAAADVFVLPSFAEGVPISLMEALAQEVVVVATNVGGVTELVRHDENGLVVPPGDADALAAALRTLAHDGDLRTRLGAAGARRVRAEFDSAVEARRLVALIRDPDGLRGVVRPEPVPHID